MAASRVLLLAPPAAEIQIRDLYCSITSKADYYWPPIDLLVLSGALSASCELTVLDAIAERASEEEAARRARAFAPDAVIALSGSASWPEDMPFLRRLKEELGCRLLVSGDFCVDPDPWPLRAFPWLDGLVRDFDSPGVAAYLEAEGRPPEPLPGLAFRGDAGIVDGGRSGAERLSYPVPRHELFPLSSYRLPCASRRPFASILTNFGCPFVCSYCIQNRDVMGHRRRPLEDTAAELRRLRELGVPGLYFRDPLFESRPSEALALCRLLAERFDFAWSCNSRVDTITEELATAMKAAGCECVAFGLETADEAALARQGKRTTREQARRAIELCRGLGLKVAGYFILGLPGETRASALETIEFAADCGVDYASFSVASPDYGTALREEAVGAGRVPGDHRRFDRSRAERSLCEGLGREGLGELLALAKRRFYGRPSYLLARAAELRGWGEFRDACRSAYALFTR